MEGVCLLLKVEPIKFKGKDGIGFVKDFWAAATGKHVLGNPKLQEILVQFDHTQLDQVRSVVEIGIGDNGCSRRVDLEPRVCLR